MFIRKVGDHEREPNEIRKRLAADMLRLPTHPRRSSPLGPPPHPHARPSLPTPHSRRRGAGIGARLSPPPRGTLGSRFAHVSLSWARYEEGPTRPPIVRLVSHLTSLPLTRSPPHAPPVEPLTSFPSSPFSPAARPLPSRSDHLFLACSLVPLSAPFVPHFGTGDARRGA